MIIIIEILLLSPKKKMKKKPKGLSGTNNKNTIMR